MGIRDETELLFSQGDLRSWLEERTASAVAHVQKYQPDEILARPPKQIADEVTNEYEVALPVLDVEAKTGGVTEDAVDVSRDFDRVITRPGPHYIDATRISLHVPYTGPKEALRCRAGTYTMNPPRAVVGNGRVTVFRALPADVLERDRDTAIAGLHEEIAKIDRHLEFAREDIRAANERLCTAVASAVEQRRRKVLADRDTEAMLGVPLHRDDVAARTYSVQPVKRKKLRRERPQPTEAFKPEPAITDDDFADIIGDIAAICLSFERLAVTYAGMEEERLRDQILTMLGNVYGPATGESFSKRGKSDIYLPWEGGDPVFLAECKWWGGPKKFARDDLPQLLDRYVVWRDTHTAMVLFIENKDATAVIDKAVGIIRDHERYLRDGSDIGNAPTFVLHKDGDPDREIKLALVTSVIHA